ncbi:MAG: M48 family metalloprotease [Bacteroidetes bacterium]|nr:M48 family metalloprotease [Bacteroidota bacterium]
MITKRTNRFFFTSFIRKKIISKLSCKLIFAIRLFRNNNSQKYFQHHHAGKITLLAVTILSCLPAALIAQTYSGKYRLQSEGKMPDDMQKVYSEKYFETLDDESVKDLKGNESREFAALTNYSIDHLLKSGRVVYGDPITRYCNKVVELLMRQTTDHSIDIRVYTLKSNDVNAYSTHQGIIIITTGLIARLSNESQLAFVLSHEISHILDNHNVQSFAYNKELFRKDMGNHKNDLEEKILKSSKHSQESEFEADNDGWKLYTAAGYDPGEIIKTFDILLYAYLPVASNSFPFNEIESVNFEINPKGKNAQIIPIEAEEDVDDSQSSHPNIKKRKLNIQRKIDASSTDYKPFSLFSQDDFNSIRKLAYTESMYRFFVNNLYIHALILADAAPQNLNIESEYLSEIKAMCYYGIMLFINEDQKLELLPDDTMQGVQQTYFHLFKRLKKKEVNAIGLRQIAKIRQQYSSNSKINRIFNQAVEEFASATKYKADYFTDPPSDTAQLKKDNHLCLTCHTMLKDIMSNSDIEAAFGNVSNTDEEDEENEKPRIREKTSKMIMFSPRYFGLDDRASANKRFMRTEKKQEFLENRIVEYAKDLNVEVKVVDAWNNKEMSTDDVNRYSLYMDWFIERNGFSGEKFKGFLLEDVKQNSGQLGAEYLGLSLYWNIIEKKKFNFLYFLGGAATFYGFPIYLKWQFTPYHYTGYVFVMMNLETGNYSFVDAKQFDVKYRNYLIQSHIYNSLNQIAK